MRRAAGFGLLMFALAGGGLVARFAAAASGPDVLPPQLEARYQHLTSELRCPVCQNEPIATSQSQIAAALREIVRQRLLAGETNGQIKAYMISRYGLFAVYKPPVELGTYLLWFGPLILLVIAGIIATRALSHRRRLLRHSDAER